ncbi:MAG: molybdopterin-guanine dinucleotide biosynthesis protein B [Deltaproteobacteria bacterium]|nr:molybdopterin-guanine dinucleotide biosynthesis protein B [Deltaproteobacteria bacterium]
MRSFDVLLEESSSIHGHLCGGQVLGVRMAMLGCREVAIDEPRGCKKLLVYVEMDRCATDAIQSVTGCSLGKRTLRFLDYGKMAAAFCNLETKKSVRVLARDEARSLAVSCSNKRGDPRRDQNELYASLPESALFSVSPFDIQIPPEDLPGAKSQRVFCDQCGEGINFRREVKVNDRLLCIPCAQGSYLRGRRRSHPALPKVLLVVGRKNVGKTTLIENLVPELSGRGYRVGTVKHHHSSSPMVVDHEGKDSWRHRQAGARSVTLVSPSQVAVFRDTEGRIPLNDLIGYHEGVDLVLVEGLRSEPITRVEVLEPSQTVSSIHAAEGLLLSTITPEKRPGDVPLFKPEEIKSLVDLIEKKIIGRPEVTASAQISIPSAL